MSNPQLSILNNPAVLERTSHATRLALEKRVNPAPAGRFLPEDLYALLAQITATLLPQAEAGTDVDIAGSIDRRLLEGTNAGWRFAALPEDREAYTQGLSVFAAMLQQTPLMSFDRMPPPAREGYLRCVANGDVDGPAKFPLSTWLIMVRTDAVKFWMSHPSTMQKMEYYGFADGATGETDGPTATEGWQNIAPNQALAFEQGIEAPAILTGREV